jgi:serine/threonine-protein kinase
MPRPAWRAPVQDTIGPYHVVRRLGAGGMGEVFLAEDPRLGRQVAIKRPTDAWLATPTARERLRREARAAAQLSHPNIAAIYDVLDDSDRPHIVMEYVEGDTLANVMMGGAISPARVVDIGVQLADALSDAHARSIIHRDLKLGNAILTPTGRVKVLDFGLATSPTASPEERLTDTGRVLGTPGYMAPEQVLGHRGDERSDIYSVGVMLYALAVGRLPFQDPDSGGQALSMLTRNEAPRADAANPAVPAPVADVIARAMARDPEGRYSSARDLREALSRVQRVLAEMPTGPSERPTGPQAAPGPRRVTWVATAAVVAIAGFAAVAVWRLQHAGGSPTPVPHVATMPVVAVLPFDVISADQATSYLGVGFSDSLTTELARVPDITVVRRDELRDFTGDKRLPLKAATAVGADVIVDASLQVQGPTLRVNAKLYRTDGKTLTQIDAPSIEGPTDHLFELQHQLAASVIASAGLGTVSQSQAPGTTDPVAQRQYWQGRAELDRIDIPGNLKLATDTLTAAVARDPSFALAHAALAEAAVAQYRDSKDASWVTLAMRESTAAVRLDPSLSDVYLARARFYRETGQPDEAIQAARHAIEIQPTNDNGHELLGDLLIDTAKSSQTKDDAIAQFREAIRLRPKLARHYDRLGVALVRMGQFDAAVAPLSMVVNLQPDNADALHKLGTAYQYKQDYPLALDYYARAIRLRPLAKTYLNIGNIQYDQGHFGDAAHSFEEAVKLKGFNESIAHRNLGDAYVRLNDAQHARAEYTTVVDLVTADLKVNPKNASNLSLLGVCLAKIGRYPEAESRIDEAMAINPGDAEVLYRKAVVLTFAGRLPEAVAALDQAIRSGYSVAVASKDFDLERLHALPGFQAAVQKRGP